ncbi:MAG: fumarylacetoacetate hydrolase family protein [Proteobacteria bacterium]|nr:fumarylacetoacetate hydrolase family protein [Pseudomonadota bacterium]MDA0993014.1 fumarylacetoacetate hydrolase family protein [Pseudomonadota bacterium]
MNLFEVPQPGVAIDGSDDRYPVRRIYCIGRNYGAHAREMGHDPDREPPFYFMKPADAVVENGSSVAYPSRTADFHHEIELVVAIGKRGSNIEKNQALNYVYGYAVGIDFTRRDLQQEAKKLGRPWDTAKGFDESAPISAIHTVTDIGHPASGRIWLAVNDEVRQNGDLSELIWGVAESVAELSTLFRLEPGDLLFTGTPAGVGPVLAGDRITGGIEGIDEIAITIR